MRFTSAIIPVILLACTGLSEFGCGGPGSPPSSSSTTSGCSAGNPSCTTAQSAVAVPFNPSSSSVTVYVADPSTTGSYGYFNEPLVSVKVCTPNHTSDSQCQIISNILLDTGSFGLRVFGSALGSNVQLTQQMVSVGGTPMDLAECALFGIGADWGPVMNGDVLFGNQTATNIPIHVIDLGFSAVPSGCASQCPDTDPCTAEYNGILGVGLFAQDCGTACSSSTSAAVNPGIYFGCDSSGCYDATSGCGPDGCMVEVPLAAQVVNPVSAFASGANNGVSLSLPSVGTSGSSAIINGSLHLGIGSTSGVTVYQADGAGLTDGNGSDFTTVYNGIVYGGSSSNPTDTTDPMLAFLDSGSNTLSFDDTSIAQCSDSPGFLCPGSTLSLSATMRGFNQTSGGTNIGFQIGNADSLLNNSNTAFSNVGTYGAGLFDWGLPFFFGRTVYVGLSGQNSTINSSTQPGPFWAF